MVYKELLLSKKRLEYIKDNDIPIFCMRLRIFLHFHFFVRNTENTRLFHWVYIQ